MLVEEVEDIDEEDDDDESVEFDKIEASLLTCCGCDLTVADGNEDEVEVEAGVDAAAVG